MQWLHRETRLVAPHAGAWIETWERKQLNFRRGVAPHAGAWIETSFCRRLFTELNVAPHAGAWIETCILYLCGRTLQSPPMRGRGLKLLWGTPP